MGKKDENKKNLGSAKAAAEAAGKQAENAELVAVCDKARHELEKVRL